MDYGKLALERHEKAGGKIEITSRVELKDAEDLAVYYTPGVATPCLAIKDDPEAASKYTSRDRLVAIVTDGSAILGLGNIGALAGMPVMEGKAILFKHFAGIDAFPICLASQDPEEIIATVKNIAPGFGGINLEDIAAPACFEVERRLKKELNIPVFHDDQHGTAIVTCAALINALRITGRAMENCKIVINGAGAAGSAIAQMAYNLGCRDILICDSKGIVSAHRQLSSAKKELLDFTNPDNIEGSLKEAVVDADVFIGVSAPGVLSSDMVKTMAKDPIIFAMANPVPEIFPDDAKAAGAAVVGTGRSDYPNQINNVLVFPSLFRGALDAKATTITEDMLIAAVYALADSIPADELCPENILPTVFNKDAANALAAAVKKAWEDR
ncbi:NADP-dependent malic enzyme [Anaerovoracaceae bacterium 41-7]|uniref:NADP-dependent malic enzyme n=1 Tax=Anaerotruncus colihominis TaxID=169435 RepID=A0A845QES7_9FIRM|nr:MULTISPECIES: NADP-dependent malic enzyme [Eubacteriales]NBH60112.1 NADP-dependent malic enzyme [Anaerotruncus colihominis]NCF00766.1 NADP-dependent malic enzyme [Anaerotruncus sp. 80]